MIPMLSTKMEVREGYQTPFQTKGFTFVEKPPTSEEAMKLAGQDWEVLERKLQTEDGKAVPGWKATVRSDTDSVLGIVKDGYKVTQNQLLYDFETALADDSGLVYETAGTFSGGKVVWCLARVPKHLRIKGDPSEIIPYLLAWTGHDGSRGFGVGATSIRVICGNTFNAARRQKDMPRLTLAHRAGIGERIGEARKALQLTFDWTETTEKVLNDMTRTKMTAADFKAFTAEFLPVNPKVKDAWKTERDRNVLIDLFNDKSKETLDGLKPTAYRALQVTTEFIDHHRTYQNTAGNTAEDNRGLSLLDGQGARMKQRAFELLTV